MGLVGVFLKHSWANGNCCVIPKHLLNIYQFYITVLREIAVTLPFERQNAMQMDDCSSNTAQQIT